jgi:MFS family permease
MAFYAFFLAGSNYFAPVICGFINTYQGWRWVFYWPAIFLAFAFIFLFFFMEETNYDRKTVGIIQVVETSPAGSISATDEEKSTGVRASAGSPGTTAGQVYSKKTFMQKMALWDPPKQNLFLHRVKRQLLFLGWPVVFYAGFSYGSYLIWFNVMNATASVILGGAPYNFKRVYFPVYHTLVRAD